MELPGITDDEKLKEVEREIAQRHRVYRRLIEKGSLSKERATYQIRVMQAVADDYKRKAGAGPLFTDGAAK